MTVPYWYAGDSAAVVLAQVTALAALVEKETGLTAYDPRTGCPLTKAPPEEPAGLMARVTEELRGRYGG
ncbi:hypothetical protein ACIPK5_27770 [Streptomyces sp. NPDC086843]|uniref:hypothetical protein n=1 Tax=Streptomyces sp. NPDC086843 TaxID=3365763 RepID=UPI00381B9489